MPVEVRVHWHALPDDYVTRLTLLGFGCMAMCKRPPTCRVTVVKRVPGLCLVGASTILACEEHRISIIGAMRASSVNRMA